MQKVDLVSLIFIIVGAVITYGSKHILKYFNVEINEVRIIVFKLVGLVIAAIGCLRVLQVI